MKNKLKDYRIQEVPTGDGWSVFYIQKKGIFWQWNEWNFGIMGFLNKEDAENKIKSLCEIGAKYHTVEQ